MEKNIGVCEDGKSGLLEIKDTVLDGVEMKANPVKTRLHQMEGVNCFLDEDSCRLVYRVVEFCIWGINLVLIIGFQERSCLRVCFEMSSIREGGGSVCATIDQEIVFGLEGFCGQ